MGRKKQEKVEEEEKKDGRRDTGVQAKKDGCIFFCHEQKWKRGRKFHRKDGLQLGWRTQIKT